MTTTEIEPTPQPWDKIIRARRAWWDLRLGQLWHYRDLIQLLVWRDFVAFYKQTVLGPAWYLIQPLMSTLVITIVFGNIAKLSTDGLPPFLFYLAGVTIWGYFAACLVGTSNTFVLNAGIFGKVYFPRLCIPLSTVLSSLISFGIRLGVFLAFWLFYLLIGAGIQPNLWAFFLPLLVILMAGLGLGFGIILSSLTTKYRDFQQLVAFGVTLWMYATPVIYPLSTVNGIWYWIMLLNPMTSIVEIFRLGFLGTSAINPAWLAYSTTFMLIVLLFGILLFNRVESTFMDTV